MSVGPTFSRRSFLRTLALGACALPCSRVMAAMGESFGLHPDTPMGNLPASPLTATPPPTMMPVFTSAKLSSPTLSLTFDDGPHPSLTPRLLDLLAERDVKATFYVIGKNVEAHPDVARRIVEEGHEISNHTWTHPALSKLSPEKVAEELSRTHDAVLDVTGYRMTGLRPPYGALNDRVREVAFQRHGYDTVLWSVDPMDWKYRNADRVSRELIAGAAPGAVLLCHDIHPSTIAAIPGAVDQLLIQGYEFTTISRLLAMDQSGRQDSNLRPPGPKPGALPS